MQEIKNLLLQIYNAEQSAYLEKEINKLLDKYSNLINQKDYALTEKDVVLITYGSQVHKAGETNLKTLNNLLDEQLGEEISIVHILPFYPYCSDDGFSVIDYYKVNPEIGSWEDIEQISNNFKLLFDAVINHTSYKCNWFEKFLENDKKYSEYYINIKDTSKFENVVRPRTSPLTHTFKSGDTEKNVWTTFSRDQVDLNFKEPDVFIQVLDILLFYISKGAQIIRLDAVGFIWKEGNTSCIHLPQTHSLIKTMRKVIEKVPSSTMLLSETNVPHKENISYFGNGDEAQMVYNFTLPPLLAYSILSGNTEKLTSWAETLELPYNNICYFNFLASHDGIGLRPVDQILIDDEINIIIESAKANGGKISFKTNPDGNQSPYEINCNYFSLLKGTEDNEELGIRRSLLAHAILLSLPGLPAIYFHSMFGSENDLEGMKESGIFRRINRQKLKYDELIEILKSDYSRQSIILNYLKKLIRVRKSEPAFNPFAPFKIENYNSQIFSIERSSENKLSTIKSFYNLGNNKVKIPIESQETMIDLISGKIFKNEIALGPLEFVWLKTQI